jgi:hypothetical protein
MSNPSNGSYQKQKNSCWWPIRPSEGALTISISLKERMAARLTATILLLTCPPWVSPCTCPSGFPPCPQSAASVRGRPPLEFHLSSSRRQLRLSTKKGKILDQPTSFQAGMFYLKGKGKMIDSLSRIARDHRPSDTASRAPWELW